MDARNITKLKMKFTQIEAELNGKRAPSRERVDSSAASYPHLRSKSHRIPYSLHFLKAAKRKKIKTFAIPPILSPLNISDHINPK